MRVFLLVVLLVVTYVTCSNECIRDYTSGSFTVNVYRQSQGYLFERTPSVIPDGRISFRRGIIFIAHKYKDYTCIMRDIALTGSTVYLFGSDKDINTLILNIISERSDVQFWTLGGHEEDGLSTLLLASRFSKLNRSYMDGNVGWIGIDVDLSDASLPNIQLKNMAATHVYTNDGSSCGFEKMPLHAVKRYVPYEQRLITSKCNERRDPCDQIRTTVVSLFTQAIGQQNQYDALNSAYKYISLMNPQPLLSVDGYWKILNGSATQALVMFPGAKIDSRAYIPLMDRMVHSGYDVYIPIMPLGSAFIEPETTERFLKIVPLLQHYTSVSVVGHSLGGTGAGKALLQNISNVKGFFSLAGTFLTDVSQRSEKMVLLYGSKDGLFLANAPGQLSRMNSNTTLIIIEGGNHHQLVSYDFLDFGDILATIGPKQQQDQVYNALITHMKSL